jgi:hypothetical protein
LALFIEEPLAFMVKPLGFLGRAGQLIAKAFVFIGINHLLSFNCSLLSFLIDFDFLFNYIAYCFQIDFWEQAREALK